MESSNISLMVVASREISQVTSYHQETKEWYVGKQYEPSSFGQSGSTKKAVRSKVYNSYLIHGTERSSILDLAIDMPFTLYLVIEC